MKNKQKFLRLTLTVTASVLLSILVVFAVVSAQSYLRSAELRVEGPATINTLEAATGLLVAGNVGIGATFITGSPPVAELDVNGWIRASGARFNTAIVDGDLHVNNQSAPVKAYTAVCDDGEKFRSGNNQQIEVWCGGVNSLPNNQCIPFLQNFTQNDSDPDNIREISCAVSSRQLYIRTDTEGGDGETIGQGSRCGAICGLELNFR